MMAKHDCGEIAVVETEENLKLIGLITDRDIAWRVVGAGKSPEQTMVAMPCRASGDGHPLERIIVVPCS